MRLRWWSAAALLAAAAAATGAAALALAVDQGPSVPSGRSVSPVDIARVYALIQRHRPDQARPGVVRAAALTERDLELLLSEAVRRISPDTRARVLIQRQRATVQLSLALPGAPLPVVGGWLNLNAELTEGDSLPRLTALRVGRLPLPPGLVVWAGERWIASRQLQPQVALALQVLNRVTLLPKTAVVAFAWPQGSLRGSLINTLLSDDDRQRLQIYTQRLAEMDLANRAYGGTVPLSEVLPPLFELVGQRLQQGGEARGSAADENRAALLALTLAAQPGMRLKLMPASAAAYPVPPVTLTLRGREDFTLHFLVSALIAAEGGGPLSDAVGVYKEVADSQGGSGFSFNDLAADRAGTRFGLLAQGDPATLQQRLSAVLSDADILPRVDDLPEFMNALQFQQRYGGVGSPTYRAMMADIESRLDGMALHNGGAAPRP